VDALALGGLIAVLTIGGRFGRITRASAAVVGLATAVGLVAIMLRGTERPRELLPVDAGGYGLAAVLAAVVVLGLVLAPRALPARLLGVRPLVHIGRLSYGLYLWNMLIKHVYERLTGWEVGRERWAEIIAIGVLLGVCELSYRYVETPLRQRWAHRPAKIATAEPVLANV
jgi:peptidoglycan/LPS O-acetylase OafA/YrhL